MTPNAFAWIALFGWSAVVVGFCRMLPPAKALMWSLVGGYLLLPFGISVDFPLLPILDKNTIPALSFLVFYPLLGIRNDHPSRTIERGSSATGTMPPFRAGNRLERTRNRPRQWITFIEWTLVLLALVGPALTVLSNAEPVSIGARFIRGLQPYDAFASMLSGLMTLLPYFLARRYLAGTDGQRTLLKSLVVAGLAYSLLAIFEMRFSPQLNSRLYGYLFQGFDQAVRDGGYRPVVFLQHGLVLAIFLCMTVLAAFAVWRDSRLGKWMLAGVWLLGTLAFARSLGALALVVVFLPFIMFAKPRTQIIVTAVAAVIVLAYPAIRGSGLMPVQQVADFTNSISGERSRSLVFRLTNENQLLARASQKPIFGWGSEGRGRVFDESGKDVSITDGLWIITLGTFGWIGYIGQFGLLTVPVVIVAVRRRLGGSRVIAGLCVVLVANVIDLIPNSGLTPLTWMVAGCLMSSARSLPASAPLPSANIVPQTGANPYGRQSTGRQHTRA